uniref:Cadherin 6 n=1 Tax=Eptatretus burgeri TaxID=7764 RepID=A0A8C4R8C9_EPTBU
MALQVCLLLELLLCAAVLTCTSALLALPRPYGSSRSLSHTLTEGAPPRSNTPVLRRVRRGWVWNQFFVLEEYTATEPVYVGKLYSDQDKGDGTVRYILTGEGAGTTFLIDEHTGDVRVTSRLDRERRAEYTLEAQAVDRVSGLPVEPASEFIIKVQDINDNEPRFPGTPFNATVTEMAEVGTPVLQVTAIDDDDPAYGNSAKLVYSILQGQPYFTIEPKTGLIRTALPGMDRETKETYLVVVEAKDMAGQRGGLTGTATVIISLSDINDNPPRFPQSTYQLSVSENAHPGSEVGRLRADDADLEGNAKVIYSTIGGDGQSTFEVITDTVTQEGIVKLRQVVDYERRQGYTLKVEAVNPTPSSRHTWPPGASRDVATVHVTVLDVDEPPVFSSEHRIFRVQEDQAVGSALGSVTARDPDAENSRVRYSIDQNTDLERMFDIGEHSGVLTLARALDHEQNVWHNISILGTQTNNEAMVGWTPVAIQVIDVNDNPPVLRPPLSMVVCENIRPGQVVQTIAAEDRDESSNPSEFRFFMGPDAKVRGNFTLRDNMNGTASLLARHGPYSRSGQPQFLLPVLVSDGGNRPLTSSATLTVQVCGCGNDGSVRRCGLEPAALAGVGTEALIALLACILILLGKCTNTTHNCALQHNSLYCTMLLNSSTTLHHAILLCIPLLHCTRQHHNLLQCTILGRRVTLPKKTWVSKSQKGNYFPFLPFFFNLSRPPHCVCSTYMIPHDASFEVMIYDDATRKAFLRSKKCVNRSQDINDQWYGENFRSHRCKRFHSDSWTLLFLPTLCHLHLLCNSRITYTCI